MSDYFESTEIINALKAQLDDAIYKGEMHRAEKIKKEIKELSEAYEPAV